VRAFDRINAVLAETKVLCPLSSPRWLPTKRLPFCRPRSEQEGEKVSDDSPFGCRFARQRCLWGKIAPEELANALRKGLLYWHPFPDRLLTSVASLPCPNAKAFLGRALVLDWRIGLDDEALNRLRETLKCNCPYTTQLERMEVLEGRSNLPQTR
jgi:hypothetical protein